MLTEKKGLHLKECWKHFLIEDSSYIPQPIRNEEADGNVLLKFSDNSIILVGGVTENSSLLISNDLSMYNDCLDNFTDLSETHFWKKRLGSKIIKTKLLKDKSGADFSIQFFLENGNDFEIIYFWETPFDTDTTVIRPVTNLKIC